MAVVSIGMVWRTAPIYRLTKTTATIANRIPVTFVIVTSSPRATIPMKAATTKYIAPRVETTVVDPIEKPRYIEMRPIPVNNPATPARAPPLGLIASDASEPTANPRARSPATIYDIAAAVLGSMDSDAALPTIIQIPQVTIVIEPNKTAESTSGNAIGEHTLSPIKNAFISKARFQFFAGEASQRETCNIPNGGWTVPREAVRRNGPRRLEAWLDHDRRHDP